MSLGHTKEDRIKTVYGGGGHAVILGAGASIAATKRNPLGDGKQLPSMDNFIEVVGLSDIVNALPEKLRIKNFESLYSKLYEDNPKSKVIIEIEKRVYDYFKDMKLPPEPTIYDYLVLALRPRDFIATFNWDPFLYQAWSRNRPIADSPYIAFPHGSVSLGYDKKDGRSGPAGWYSKATKEYFEPSKLLYPVTKKNYAQDEFVIDQWEMIKSFLSDKAVKQVTIFGYGAPETDKEAMKLLNDAWGTGQNRADEQFEIIDIRPEKKVMKQWKNFIYSGHTDYTTDYFKSSLAYNPRRTFESYHQHYFPMTIEEAFSASNPVPSDFKTLQELWDWHKPLIDAELKHKNQQATK
jgi:hypothetical protein